MVRDSKGSKVYWDKWVNFMFEDIRETSERCKISSENLSYRPQYVFELTKSYWELMFFLYSRGDSIKELAQYFDPMLDAWEESERLGKEVWSEDTQYTRHAFEVNLDFYIFCFWLVGLALTLDIPDDEWKRLLALVGNEGKDTLMDRIIATREPSRKIGDKLCFSKPYDRLLKAIDASPAQQAKLLFSFVDKWHAELKQTGEKKKKLFYDKPYWYDFGQADGIEGGAYFGYWCVEAAAAVKAFGLDDSLCLGHPHYPGDLLRPDGPTTHQVIKEEVIQPSTEQNVSEAEPSKIEAESKNGWFKSLFGKK